MRLGLRGNGLRKAFYDEEINPLDGVVNIVDAMLVFSCGLMLSLVIYWNVDLGGGGMVSIDKGSEVSEIGEIQDNINQSKNGSDVYEKMGTVYRDPISGKLYMLEE